ncbi:MAG: hypothetical protein HOV81_14330 [Kofleriaceae bacterium]|nr:hypothetical protein [Kofleriaceae bacterium]
MLQIARAMRRFLACLLVVAACADGGEVVTDETEVSPELDAKADAATEVSVRAGDTTLTVNKVVTRRDGPNGPELVLRGKTTRTLTDGRGFVFDDVYGDFAQKSARVFELTWPVSTARTLTDGVDQFIGLSFVHSSSRPDNLTARVVVRPRLATFTGSSKIYLTAELTPIVYGGTVVYRIDGHTYGANTGVRAVLDGVDLTDVRRPDDTNFSIDLSPDQAYGLLARGDLQVIASFPTGGVDKRVTLGLSIKKLGMTSGDAYEVWPPPTCTSTTRSCLLGLADGALDLGGCGEAIKVNACAGQVGVFVDDVAFQATLHTADTRLATSAAHDDAVALVGADKANEFLFAAKQVVEGKLEQQLGRWYLSAGARQTALDGALEGGLDVAYARPFDYLEAHAAVPGNAAAMRNVAADAVLAELDRMDFVHTEFARTLEDLTHEYRAMHVADIAEFRTNVEPEPYPGQPTWDVYIGSWLGCHTEVAIERATGNVVQTLVEID